MNYILILTCSMALLIVSNLFGNKIARYLNLNNELQYTVLGFAAILATLFVVYIPMVLLKMNATIVNGFFVVILVVIGIYSLLSIKKDMRYKTVDLLIVFAYILLMIFLSSRVTIGEQMSDSNFYFTIVQRNVDSVILNQFSGYNGGIYSQSMIGIFYIFQSFYQLFSSILWFFKLFFNDYVIGNAIYMWSANILFYFFTVETLLNAHKLFRSKIGSVLNFIFIGLFLGSVYYNLSLPHIGVIFQNVLLSAEILILYQCLKNNNYNCAWIIAIFTLAMISCSSSALFLSFFLSYSYIMVLFYFKDKKAISVIWIVALPIMIYSVLFINNLYFTIICLALELAFWGLDKITSHNDILLERMIKLFRNMVFVVPIIMIAVGLWSSGINSYLLYAKDFFVDYSTYDRLQNYFGFKNMTLTIQNIIYYVSLLALIINKNTRKMGILLVIIIITFINPFTKVFIFKYLTQIDVYQRIFYLLFNSGLIIIGIYALIEILDKFKWIKIITMSLMIVSSGYFFYHEITTPFHEIYVPSEQFNTLYKFDQTQIDAVKALSYFVKDENLYYPRVVSQIYATIIIEPKITLINGVMERRLYQDAYKDDEDLRRLIEVFYTPIFMGDDGNRFDADYRDMDEILKKAQIDLVIVDRTLYVANDDKQWVPLYFYVAECATMIYENERYIVYSYSY